MSKQFLFLLAGTMLVAACSFGLDSTPSKVQITNNSEHNITRVAIADVWTSFIIVDKRSDELIAKGGNSKTFDVRGEEIPGKFIVCVEAGDTSGLMCAAEFALRNYSSKSFIWVGNDSPDWFPIDDFPMEVL